MLAQRTITTNKGVLQYLLADAAGQEAKEFVVAYTLLALAAEPLTLEQLRAAADSLLQRAGLAEIDFDVEDALVELEKLGLLVREGALLVGVSDLRKLQEAVSLAEFQDKVVGRCAPCPSCAMCAVEGAVVAVHTLCMPQQHAGAPWVPPSIDRCSHCIRSLTVSGMLPLSVADILLPEPGRATLGAVQVLLACSCRAVSGSSCCEGSVSSTRCGRSTAT